MHRRQATTMAKGTHAAQVITEAVAAHVVGRKANWVPLDGVHAFTFATAAWPSASLTLLVILALHLVVEVQAVGVVVYGIRGCIVLGDHGILALRALEWGI
jgi:hypothetical protein